MLNDHRARQFVKSSGDSPARQLSWIFFHTLTAVFGQTTFFTVDCILQDNFIAANNGFLQCGLTSNLKVSTFYYLSSINLLKDRRNACESVTLKTVKSRNFFCSLIRLCSCSLTKRMASPLLRGSRCRTGAPFVFAAHQPGL